ncbi:MAG: DUF2069 domain-containing protein [Janthinobacterium lividum]
MQNPTHKACYYSAVGSLLALIALCIAWETVLAPLRPHGSWMVLKVVPLLIPLRGIWKRDVYTLQWSSMLILLYLAEGVVRAWSDSGISAVLGMIEVMLVCVFFISCLLFLQPYKKAARALAQRVIQKASRSIHE